MDYAQLVRYVVRVKLLSDLELLELKDYVYSQQQHAEWVKVSDKKSPDQSALQKLIKLIHDFSNFSAWQLIANRMDICKQLLLQFEEIKAGSSHSQNSD